MKGLNCYASFCVASGTKKSLTLTQAKDGFFVPGDTVDVQRGPLFCIAVAGLLACLWAQLYPPLNPTSPVRTGRCIFLYCFFHPRRAARGLISEACSFYPSSPPDFLRNASFYSEAVPVRSRT